MSDVRFVLQVGQSGTPHPMLASIFDFHVVEQPKDNVCGLATGLLASRAII